MVVAVDIMAFASSKNDLNNNNNNFYSKIHEFTQSYTNSIPIISSNSNSNSNGNGNGNGNDKNNDHRVMIYLN